MQHTFIEPVSDAVVKILLSTVVGDLDWSCERVELEIQVIIVHKCLQCTSTSMSMSMSMSIKIC